METIIKNLEALTSMLLILVKVGVQELKKTPANYRAYDIKRLEARERGLERKIKKLENTKPSEKYGQSAEEIAESLDEAAYELKEAKIEKVQLEERLILEKSEHARRVKLLEDAGF